MGNKDEKLLKFFQDSFNNAKKQEDGTVLAAHISGIKELGYKSLSDAITHVSGYFEIVANSKPMRICKLPVESAKDGASSDITDTKNVSINYKERINKILEKLQEGLIEKEETLSLTLLCMLAQKSVFFFGPPGTAKSLMARRISCAFKSNKFFDYLMNRFSTPEDVFGPIRLSELKKDNLVRKIDGFLPDADFAFLDEIWKSGPAILNSLLTIINEKQFRNNGENRPVKLKGLIAASNEFPQKGQGLEALYDRFIMRLYVPQIENEDNFEKLLKSKPVSKEVEIDDSLKFSNEDLDEIQNLANMVSFDDVAFNTLKILKELIDKHNTDENKKLKGKTTETAMRIEVSDRRWINVIELLRVCAVLNGRDKIMLGDLLVIKHCFWSEVNQKEFIEKMFNEALERYGDYKKTKADVNDVSLKERYDSLAKEISDALDAQNSIGTQAQKNYMKDLENYKKTFEEKENECEHMQETFFSNNENIFIVTKSEYDKCLTHLQEAEDCWGKLITDVDLLSKRLSKLGSNG